MAQKTGTITTVGTESRLDQDLLAICGDPSPLDAATGFLADRGIGNGDSAMVTYTEGHTSGGTSVFCMTAAVKV